MSEGAGPAARASSCSKVVQPSLRVRPPTQRPVTQRVPQKDHSCREDAGQRGRAAVVPALALAACLHTLHGVDPAVAAAVAESPSQRTSYVRIERRNIENLLIKQFKASLSELTDEELGELFEEAVIQRQSNATDMLLRAPSLRGEEQVDRQPEPVSSRDASPVLRNSNSSQRGSEAALERLPGRASLDAEPGRGNGGPLGAFSNLLAPEREKPAPTPASPAPPPPPAPVPVPPPPPIQQAREPAALPRMQLAPEPAPPPLQYADDEGDGELDPTLQLLQQLMGQVPASPSGASAPSSTPPPLEPEAPWQPLAAVLDQLPDPPQLPQLPDLPELPDLPGLGEAASNVGAAGQEVIDEARAVVSGLFGGEFSSDSRLQAALGIGSIAAVVLAVALITEVREQRASAEGQAGSSAAAAGSPEPGSAAAPSAPRATTASPGSQGSSSGSEGVATPLADASAQPPKPVAGASAGAGAPRPSEAGSPRATSRRTVSPISKRGGISYEKLLDNGPSDVSTPPTRSPVPYPGQAGAAAAGPAPGGWEQAAPAAPQPGAILWQRQPASPSQGPAVMPSGAGQPPTQGPMQGAMQPPQQQQQSTQGGAAAMPYGWAPVLGAVPGQVTFQDDSQGAAGQANSPSQAPGESAALGYSPPLDPWTGRAEPWANGGSPQEAGSRQQGAQPAASGGPPPSPWDEPSQPQAASTNGRP